MKSSVCNIVLYHDSSIYDCAQVFERLGVLGCEWYAISHECDLEDDGSPKKQHYHAVMRFENSRSFSALAKDLGIPENAIEKSKSFDYGVRYLIHLDQPDKAQYDRSLIFGSGSPDKYLDHKPKKADIYGVMLMDAIYSGQCRTVYELYRYAKELDAWSEFRRGFSMYNTVLVTMWKYDQPKTTKRDEAWEIVRDFQSEREAAIYEKTHSVSLTELPNEVIPEFNER